MPGIEFDAQEIPAVPTARHQRRARPAERVEYQVAGLAEHLHQLLKRLLGRMQSVAGIVPAADVGLWLPRMIILRYQAGTGCLLSSGKNLRVYYRDNILWIFTFVDSIGKKFFELQQKLAYFLYTECFVKEFIDSVHEIIPVQR